jgi:glucan biosynthesis protein C
VSVPVGFYMVQWNADVLVKFLVIAVCSLVAIIGLYDLLVRRTNVTRLLFGMKPMRRTAAPGVVLPSGGSGA